MHKVIVTGSNGFVGTALCRALTEKGIEVIAVVRNEKADVSVISHFSNIRIVYCDLAEFKNLATLIPDRDVDVLYHLAWVGSAGPLRGNVNVQMKNIEYTCDTVNACRNLHCKKFVFASSIMEYEIEALMETGDVPSINTLYSSAKVAADYFARTVAGALGVEYIRAVISNIYGPGEISPRLINTSLMKLLKNEHCSFSAGEQIYDFIYVTDAAESFVSIGECGVANRTYYIGSKSPKPLKEFLYEMRDQVDPSIKIGVGEIPFRGVSLTYNEFDIHALEKDTGFVPKVDFSTGIKHTIKWLKDVM